MSKGAVVLELNSCNITLLTDEGAFLRIPVRRLPGARYIGQHVDLNELRPLNYGRWVSVVAACLLFLLVIPLFRPTPAQAWVTMDGASSLEVLLDYRFRVIEIRSLNNGGQQFLDDLQEGLSFSALVDSYLTWSSANGDGTVLITSTASTEAINKIVGQRTADNVNVVVFEVDPLAREEAGKLGVSTGRALFLAGADNQGISISLEQIKESNPFTTLDAAGANVEQVVSSTSDRGTQAEQIQKLPEPDPELPDDTAKADKPAGPGQGNKDTPPGQEDKDTPPGQVDKDIPRGQQDKDTPPGQKDIDTPPGQEDIDTPPGQEDKDTPPGQEGKDIPPGQEGKDTPPGQEDKDTPPGQEGKDTPPGQEDKETPPGQKDKDTPPGQRDKDFPPVQRDKAEKDGDKPPYGLKEKFNPRPTETALSWKEEKTGPPFKEKDKSNSSSNNGNSRGKDNSGKDNSGKDNPGKGNNKNKP